MANALRPSWRRLLATAAAVLTMVPWSVHAAPLPRCTLITLGSLDSTAVAINARGQVAGTIAVSAGITKAFLWSGGTLTLQNILPGGQSSTALGLNNNGQVVGDIDGQAAIWTRGRSSLLASQADAVRSVANGINDWGLVVGTMYFMGPNYAVTWLAGHPFTLARSPNGFFSEAYAVNNAGQIVGLQGDGFRRSDATLWNFGRPILLPELFADSHMSVARALNNRGQVVGDSRDVHDPGSPHAVLWYKGTVTDLGILPGAYSSSAHGINDAGQIVGESSSQAVLWDHGQLINLGAMFGASYSTAWAINNRGEVAGELAGHAVIWRC